MEFFGSHSLKSGIVNIAIPDMYVEHGNAEILQHVVGMDQESVTERITAEYQRLNR